MHFCFPFCLWIQIVESTVGSIALLYPLEKYGLNIINQQSFVSACERLILLETDPRELRDYGALLYHAGFYEEALHFLKYYLDAKVESTL